MKTAQRRERVGGLAKWQNYTIPVAAFTEPGQGIRSVVMVTGRDAGPGLKFPLFLPVKVLINMPIYKDHKVRTSIIFFFF